MISDQSASRRHLLRLAIAYALPWAVVLVAISLFGTLLILLQLPWLIVVNLIWASDSLMVLSIVVIPLVAFLHARLWRRGSFSLLSHIAIGAGIPSTVMLLVVLCGVALRATYWLIPPSVVFPPVLALLTAAVTGGLSSGVAWYFVLRPLRAPAPDIVGRFD